RASRVRPGAGFFSSHGRNGSARPGLSCGARRGCRGPSRRGFFSLENIMSKAKRKYEYRPGREHSIPVEELAEEFDRMRAIEGKDPSPRMIVDYARDPDSRLHGEFT